MNMLATVALCCSLLGLLTCLPAPIGAVLGHVARRSVRRRGERGGGVALLAIVIGWGWSALVGTATVAYMAYIVYKAITDPSPSGGGGGYSHHGGFDDILILPGR